MSCTIIRPKDRAEWLEERKKGLGSSDAGTILGASPFSSPLRLWRQKLGLDPPVPETDAMRNGHYLEAAVAEWFANETASRVDPDSAGDWLAVDDERPYLRVSPDRIFWPEGAERDDANRCILEIKSTSKIVDPGNLPLYWICQVQYQMGVMGIDMAAIAWVTGQPRLSMGHTWVRFNPAFYKTLTDALDRFWNVNILQRVPPEAVDEEDIRILFPRSEARHEAATVKDVETCKLYNELEREMDDLGKRLESVGTEIKARMRDAETLVWIDPDTGEMTTIARFRSVNETVLDEDRLRDEEPEEYAKYMRRYFDKKLFKEEDKDRFKRYSTTRKGARRFSVQAI